MSYSDYHAGENNLTLKYLGTNLIIFTSSLK